MNRTLTQAQKDEIRQSLLRHDFSAEEEIGKLVDSGYDIEEAKTLLIAELKAYKQDMFQRTLKRKNQEERRKVLWLVVFMISIIGPVFEISSPAWYALVVPAAGLCGYFAYTDKPIAGVLAAMIFPMLVPYTYNWYMAGRTSFIRIEMLIPVGIAMIPSVIIYFLIAKTVYANSDNS